MDKSLDHLFRRKYSELLSALVKSLGPQHFQLAEEAIQSAYQEAVHRWPISGSPDNPAGWIFRVAKFWAIDQIRKSGSEKKSLDILAIEIGQNEEENPERDDGGFEAVNQLDDLAKMILLCCNPDLSHQAQICVTLKFVAGFSTHEISSLLFLKDETTKKIITRSRDKLESEMNVNLLVEPERVIKRFDGVLETLYAMFTESFSNLKGENPLRRELAEESIRITDNLISSELIPPARKPELNALLALMLFHFSRFDSRTDSMGVPLPLQDQDRHLWDQEMIAAGVVALQKSIQTENLTFFHIEARIAAAHSTSPTFESTDWVMILRYYDQLLEMRDTTLVRFNRAVAVRFAEGPEKGLEALESLNLTDNAKITESSALSFLSHSIRGDLFDALNRQNEALQEWRLAVESARTQGEKELARKNMEKILKKVSPK